MAVQKSSYPDDVVSWDATAVVLNRSEMTHFYKRKYNFNMIPSLSSSSISAGHPLVLLVIPFPPLSSCLVIFMFFLVADRSKSD